MREASIKGFPEYTIREDGKIYSKIYKKMLTYSWNGSIWTVLLIDAMHRPKCRSVAKLMLESFGMIPDKRKQVEYADGDRGNLALSNLSWREKWIKK